MGPIENMGSSTRSYPFQTMHAEDLGVFLYIIDGITVQDGEELTRQEGLRMETAALRRGAACVGYLWRQRIVVAHGGCGGAHGDCS
jgi:hypothetical protein